MKGGKHRQCKGSEPLDLPVPWCSSSDAGRYVGTWHINVTKDRETESRNVGVSGQATVCASPNSHLSCHFAKAERQVDLCQWR